ncbi:MAG: PepSY domain-containing protein [Saccharospirillum sp.]
MMGRTVRAVLGLLVLAVLVSVTATWAQSGHPCPGVSLPLTEERAVVQVGECLFQGRVVKVDRLSSGGSVVFRVRVLSTDGRVRNIDLDAATGLPIDPAIREEVNAAFGR